MSRTGSTVGGAATGAAAGSVLGPWGTVGGAIIGGIGGYLSGGGPSDAEIAAQEAQARARQQATDMALAEAQGTGPSAAQALLNKNVAQGNMLAMSRAKSLAGTNPALAQTLASNEAASNSQEGLMNAAILRQQDQQQGIQNYLAATGVNVGAAQTRDAAQTAQSNLQSQYNDKLYNSILGGASQAAGRYMGSTAGGST